MLFRKKTLLSKIEPVYGVDAAPDGTNVIRVRNLQISPYEGPRITTGEERETLGNEEEINTAPHTQLTFEVLMVSSGTLGTPPGWGPLIRACGFDETINAGTSVVYAPIDDSFEAVTNHYIIDGQLHAGLGSRGNVAFSFPRGQVPFMRFTMPARYVPPVAASAITAAPAGFGLKIPVNGENTQLTFDGHSPCTEEFTLDMGGQTPVRNIINCRNIPFVDRAPAGPLRIEAVDLATKNYFSLLESHNGVTTGALQLVNGTTPGNTIQIDVPALQLSALPSIDDSDGEAIYPFNTRALPVSGNDEITITVR